MPRKKEREQDIIAASTSRRPNGVRLALLIEPGAKFCIDGECTLLTSQGHLIRLIPNVGEPERLYLPSHQCWDIIVEGFVTAGEAEQVGLKVALGFIWIAVSREFAARLLYSTPLPCSVFDRTRGSQAIGTAGSCKATFGLGVDTVVDRLEVVLSSTTPADRKLLLAMELFASSRLETTTRSRFIGLVSSLEPLADQQRYKNSELDQLIASFKETISNSAIPEEVRTSVASRIDHLKSESISAAIRRLVRQLLPDEPELVDAVTEAYAIRSRILHDGASDCDLEAKTREIQTAIRRIFSRIMETEYFKK